MFSPSPLPRSVLLCHGPFTLLLRPPSLGEAEGGFFLTHWTWVKPQKEKAPSASPGRQGQAAAAPAGDLGPKPRLPALGTRTSALTSVSLITFMCQWGTPLRHRVATGGRNTGHTRGGGVNRPRQRRASLDSGQLKATSACILRRQAAGLRLALRDLLRTGQRDSQNQRAAGGGWGAPLLLGQVHSLRTMVGTSRCRHIADSPSRPADRAGGLGRTETCSPKCDTAALGGG